MSRGLPSGRVTFAFTDVVGSTRAFAEHGERYVDALQSMHARVAALVGEHGGVVVKTEGDGAFLAFADAASAADCLQAVQADAAEQGDGLLRLQMRAGAHTGEALAVDGDYVSGERPSELPYRHAMGSADPADSVAARDEVRQLLNTLAPRARTKLVLRYYADLGDAAIAEAMGISESGVRATVSRALGALRSGTTLTKE
jgi:RNA polymerase sigma factor (sigma-70 family)